MDCELGVLAAAVNYGTSATDCGMCTMSSQASAFAFNHNEITTTAPMAGGIPLLSNMQNKPNKYFRRHGFFG